LADLGGLVKVPGLAAEVREMRARERKRRGDRGFMFTFGVRFDGVSR
jgi:hypothetical protein